MTNNFSYHPAEVGQLAMSTLVHVKYHPRKKKSLYKSKYIVAALLLLLTFYNKSTKVSDYFDRKHFSNFKYF